MIHLHQLTGAILCPVFDRRMDERRAGRLFRLIKGPLQNVELPLREQPHTSYQIVVPSDVSPILTQLAHTMLPLSSG